MTCQICFLKDLCAYIGRVCFFVLENSTVNCFMPILVEDAMFVYYCFCSYTWVCARQNYDDVYDVIKCGMILTT